MNKEPKQEGPKDGKPAKVLSGVLEQSARVKDLVGEVAEELSSVNVVLAQELATGDTPPVVQDAIEKNVVAEEKVQEATEQLAVVNEALKAEVRARHVLEFQYAAANEQKDAARHESLHDPLTGLPNRALFNDRLEQALVSAELHSWNLAVMFLELHGFKDINDEHGHDVSDKLLQTVTARLQENSRSDDTASRHSGDEILYLVMESGSQEQVKLIVEKLIGVLEAPCEVSVGDATVSPEIRVSIGIAMFPENGIAADALIKAAGKAMYRARKDQSRYSFAE
ncbi:MAG: GGDEF domain-containing protein [Burkholderiales bacterium]|nr:GGDEF domain-containing protein [Burkholderiales bacterium]